MTVNQISVAELERKLLDGHAVTADDLAQAKAREDAAARVEELQNQRKARLEQERRRTEGEAKLAKHEQRAAQLANDPTIKNLRNAIYEAVDGYLNRVKEHNAELTCLRGDVEHIVNNYPELISPRARTSHAGDVYFDEHTISRIDDWERGLQTVFVDAIVQAKRKYAEKYGVDGSNL